MPPAALARLRLVLLRPRNPENLGAVARVMKNLGLASWTLVDPRTLDFHAARRVAVHSEELLDKPRITASLDEAVADAAWVVGTSSRADVGLTPMTPRTFALEAARRAANGQEVALVFGDERSGMTNDELARCHALSRIPVEPEQPSMNLAQAVAVHAWELRMAAWEPSPAPTPRLATDAELAALEARLGEAFPGFLREGREEKGLRALMRPLQRAGLTRRELELWMAATAGTSRR